MLQAHESIDPSPWMLWGVIAYDLILVICVLVSIFLRQNEKQDIEDDNRTGIELAGTSAVEEIGDISPIQSSEHDEESFSVSGDNRLVGCGEIQPYFRFAELSEKGNPGGTANDPVSSHAESCNETIEPCAILKNDDEVIQPRSEARSKFGQGSESCSQTCGEINGQMIGRIGRFRPTLQEAEVELKPSLPKRESFDSDDKESPSLVHNGRETQKDKVRQDHSHCISEVLIEMRKPTERLAQTHNHLRQDIEVIVPTAMIMVLARKATMLEEGLIGKESQNDTERDQKRRAMMVASGMHRPVRNVTRIDVETRRFLKLAVPWTVTSVFDAIFKVVMIGIISSHPGHDTMVAYVTVQFTLEMSEILAGGINDAEFTAATHAIGARNFDLAGQYAQIAAIVRVLLVIPMLCFWCHFMDVTLLFFGFDQNVADLALRYTRVTALCHLANALRYPYAALIDLAEHANFNALIFGSENAVVLLVTICAVEQNDVDLITIGLIQVVSNLAFFALHLYWTLKNNWLEPFSKGLFHDWAMSNKNALVKIMQNGTILAAGNLFSLCEWKMLLFFAAYHGPVEMTAWIISGAIWDIVDACTYELASAAEARVAYQLGRGDIGVAKKTSYVFLGIGFSVAILIFLIVMMWGETLASFLTPAEDLQRLLCEVLPLIGFGNLSVVFETMSLSLVEGQGRVKLANQVYVICSLFITIPLAALMVYVFNVDLQGIAAAIVVGHSTCGAILTFILLTSDWLKVSTKVRAMAVEPKKAEDHFISRSSRSLGKNFLV